MTREEAIETLRANYPDKCYELLRNAVDVAIEALKAEQPHGHWINERGVIGWTCSNCHDHIVLQVYLNGNYCPTCGAIMDGEIVDLHE